MSWTKPTSVWAAKSRAASRGPIQTNIPEVIRLLKANKLDEAGRMLFGQHRTIPAGAVLKPQGGNCAVLP